MKKQVSLREIVATKIVYAVILASFYWMWSRSDWQSWYQTAQTVLGIVLLAFIILQAVRIQKYKRDCVDEMAEQNLRRCDAVCLKVFVIAMAALAFACGILGHVDAINAGLVGWVIVLLMIALSILRTVLFVIMDSRGV